jgi:hypothetical protein
VQQAQGNLPAALQSYRDSLAIRASGLNLVIAAIVYWNATYLEDALVHFRAAGELVPDELLPHTSPLSWEHISLSGDFLWERAAAFATERRSLNLAMRRAVA